MNPWLVSLATGSLVAPAWLTVADSERPALAHRPARSAWLGRVSPQHPARLTLELTPPVRLRLVTLTSVALKPGPDLTCTVTDASGSVLLRSWPGFANEKGLALPLGDLGAIRTLTLEATRSSSGPPLAIAQVVGWTATEPSRDIPWPAPGPVTPKLHGLVLDPGSSPTRCVVVGERLPTEAAVMVDDRHCTVVASTPTQLLCTWTGKPPVRAIQLVVRAGSLKLSRRVRAVARAVVWPPPVTEAEEP